MNAISEKVIQTKAGKELKSVTFARTPIMSTYLVAMAVGEFDFVETKAYPKSPSDAKPIDVRVYTLKGQSAQGKFGLEVAARTLEFFSSYFDIAYPLPKMDLVAIPDFAAGAMENWGLVTYREICLLYDEKTTSAAIKQRIAYVVGHELAHQWFGNLVTMDWWAELWLNEGFATFVGWMAVDNLFPEWKVWTQFVTNDYANGLSLDALRSSHPIEVDVKSPSEINQIFDAISYSKGASVIRMLNAFLGQDNFMNGVRIYLKKHAYSNATTLDLWAALSKSAGKDIPTLMHAWTRKMGYPMVTIVKESLEGGQMTLTLRQERYLATGGGLKAGEEDTVWWIPLNIVSHLSPQTPQPLILTEKEATVSFPYDSSPGAWYKLNFGTTGFYRVNLNQVQLSKLGSVLSKQEDHPVFDTTDRIGILTDAFALAVAGYGSTTGALEIVKAYEKEEEYNVLEEVDHALSRILACFYAEPVELSQGIRSLRRKIFGPKVQKLGYEYPPKEDHLTSLKRTLTIRAAASAGDASVVEELSKRFKAFIGGDETQIHPNLRKTVFMTVLAESKDPLTSFDQIVGIYKSTPSVDQKLAALSTLGAASSVEALNKLLDMVLDSEQVKPQDIIYPLSTVGDEGSNKLAKLERLWSWVRENWVLLHDRYKASLSLLGRVLQAAIAGRIGAAFVEDVEGWARGDDLATQELKDKRKDELKTARRPLEQSLEKVRGYTAWVERERGPLLEWVKQQSF
jgi:aminopeptidase 2